MFLERLSLRGFRNYEELELAFPHSLNLFYGNNAQGKTNLLEAIYVLAITRSFRTKNDRELLKFEHRRYDISGEFVDELSVKHRVAIGFDLDSGKQISLNHKRLQRSSALIGKSPVVHFSPESHRITSGPPVERRRFVDTLLCQSSASYLADLQDYNRVLRQRNALLAQSHGSPAKILSTWDQSLATYGCRVVSARAQFVDAYASTLQKAYGKISASSDSLALTYRSQLGSTAVTSTQYLMLLEKSRDTDLQRGQTQVGPHRDDLILKINGKELRRYGSRGEHKSALIALKMAEAAYLSDKTGTLPIILIDDLSSELDAVRTHSTLEYFRNSGQVFITSTSPIAGEQTGQCGKYEIVAGEVFTRNE